MTSLAPCVWHTDAALCKCYGAFISLRGPRCRAPMWPRMNVTVSLSYCELSNLEELLTFAEYMIAHNEYGDNRSLKAQDLKTLRSASAATSNCTGHGHLKVYRPERSDYCRSV